VIYLLVRGIGGISIDNSSPTNLCDIFGTDLRGRKKNEDFFEIMNVNEDFFEMKFFLA
jgi:hypothetical protein